LEIERRQPPVEDRLEAVDLSNASIVKFVANTLVAETRVATLFMDNRIIYIRYLPVTSDQW
jgi:hypothetical protein